MSRLGQLPVRVVRGTRLLEAALLLTATRVVLRASPRRLTAKLLRHASVLAPQSPSAPGQSARDIAEDVNRVALLLPGSTCLGRAFTGWLMLRKRGVASVVRVGAQRAESGLRMHAWLEVGGAALIGREEAAEFVALTRVR
jgi:Transglutaminase-like superfamily